MDLQGIRLKRKIEQADLAKRVGTNAPMMSNFEHYKCLPTPPMLAAMCKELKCEIGDIYKDDEIYIKTSSSTRTEKSKSSSGGLIYQLSGRLPIEKRKLFSKINLKKCGYNSIQDFIEKCVKAFEKRLNVINKNEKTAKHLHCPAVNESGYNTNLSHH